ncbi:hypothetical protein [Anatilimnocola aggregata]|uniref:hypothetical protein n=1 Tax=Anatilimnocola aggregata TaxID=2528021 RepID=UPI0011A7FCD7|nr:hypothetical protein [Anatilimnocola aggregata]
MLPAVSRREVGSSTQEYCPTTVDMAGETLPATYIRSNDAKPMPNDKALREVTADMVTPSQREQRKWWRQS